MKSKPGPGHGERLKIDGGFLDAVRKLANAKPPKRKAKAVRKRAAAKPKAPRH